MSARGPGVASLVVLSLVAASTAFADEALDFRTYFARVLAANPDLAAAHANVDISRAQIEVAKASPDPQLTAGLTQLDVSRRGNPTAAGIQLSVPVELGGKRSARVAGAQAGYEVAGLDYEDAVRALRAQAANAFVEALHARLVEAQKERSLAGLAQLVSVNERRLLAGDISEAELLQSQVEAQLFRAEVLAARGGRQVADIALLQLLGAGDGNQHGFDGRPANSGLHLQSSTPRRCLQRLRSARTFAQQRSGSMLQTTEALAQANPPSTSRGVSWQHNFAVGGELPLPPSDFLGASVSVPLPFSRAYRGELEGARSAHRQAQLELEAVRVRAAGQLRQALALFAAAASRVALYESGALAHSKTVLEKALYSYQRGGATLVEVLIAQRTDSQVNLGYLDALSDRAHALVAVDQAAGDRNLVTF